MNKTVITIICVGLVFVGTYVIFNRNVTPQDNPLNEKVIVYKTETCGCCKVFSNYLDRQGVEVEEVNVSDLTEIKNEYGVPSELGSCHTTIVGNYFVEGHVSLDVIEKLVVEQPEIKGIALPGMPSGTPGMPGPKTEDWVIYSVDYDGKVTEYITI